MIEGKSISLACDRRGIFSGAMPTDNPYVTDVDIPEHLMKVCETNEFDTEIAIIIRYLNVSLNCTTVVCSKNSKKLNKSSLGLTA